MELTHKWNTHLHDMKKILDIKTSLVPRQLQNFYWRDLADGFYFQMNGNSHRF